MLPMGGALNAARPAQRGQAGPRLLETSCGLWLGVAAGARNARGACCGRCLLRLRLVRFPGHLLAKLEVCVGPPLDDGLRLAFRPRVELIEARLDIDVVLWSHHRASQPGLRSQARAVHRGEAHGVVGRVVPDAVLHPRLLDVPAAVLLTCIDLPGEHIGRARRLPDVVDVAPRVLIMDEPRQVAVRALACAVLVADRLQNLHHAGFVVRGLVGREAEGRSEEVCPGVDAEVDVRLLLLDEVSDDAALRLGEAAGARVHLLPGLVSRRNAVRIAEVAVQIDTILVRPFAVLALFNQFPADWVGDGHDREGDIVQHGTRP
mmetsp:Transcript_8590/g.24691  ORF Transcript_8590/g.24691 Transcript_8590/m.24691 type:complete len:319 (+) Transcript_8590:137-1093(+)